MRDFIPNTINELAGENFFVFENQGEFPKLRYVYSHSLGVRGFIFLICTQGFCRARINLREFIVKANTIVSIPPSFIVEFLETSEDYRVCFLFYSYDFVSDINIPNTNLPIMIQQNPCLYINDDEQKKLLSYYSMIRMIYHDLNNIYRNEIAKHLLASLRMEVATLYTQNIEKRDVKSTRKEEIFNQFLYLVVVHSRTNREVAFYAEKLCISPKYLSEIVKTISKQSAIHWIEFSVITICKTVLKSSKMSITQISEDLNFPNTSYFGRFFKRHTGMTPFKYRES